MHSFLKDHESLRFSRSNRRLSSANLSRIDKFYVSESFANNNGGSVKIMLETVFFDRALIIFTLANMRRKESFHLKIANGILLYDKYFEEVHDESFREGAMQHHLISN